MYTESYQTNEQKFSFGGVFWPLNKWKHEGFEDQLHAIEHDSLPENIRSHPILGKTYRVPLLETSTAGSQGSKTGDVVEANVANKLDSILAKMNQQALLGNSTPAPALTNGPPPTTEGGDQGDKAEDDSTESSSSTSSSSSSSKKKKKRKGKSSKKKKRKADKKKKKAARAKAKEAEAKALAKAQETESRKRKVEVKKAITPIATKLAKTFASLEAACAHENFAALFPGVRDQASANKNRCTELTAKFICDNDLPTDFEQAKREVEEITKFTVMLNIMLRASGKV
jgi:NADH dehydrogenase/NADH:ubiquinone oxidoreductase subunit G